jgi:hypothetical protein
MKFKYNASGKATHTPAKVERCCWCGAPLILALNHKADERGLVYHPDCWERMAKWLRMAGCNPPTEKPV